MNLQICSIPNYFPMFKRIVRGFTLIELLIVIAIIGILAVAFLPSVLNAPAKGRDAARVAAIQKIQSALLNYNLEGNSYPEFPTTASIVPESGIPGTAETWNSQFAKSLGGTFPIDPSKAADGNNIYYKYYTSPGNFSFGLSANMETFESANASCPRVEMGLIIVPLESNKTTWCYAVLVE